jgi:hypothetical protein
VLLEVLGHVHHMTITKLAVVAKKIDPLLQHKLHGDEEINNT